MGTKISALTALTTPVAADLLAVVDTTASPDETKKITIANLLTSPITGLTASEIVGTDSSKVLVSLAVATYPSLTELSYVKGVTSALQTQLGLKAPLTAPTFATSVTGSYLTASEILITDGSKNIVSAAVATYPSLTELTYVKGVTSALQTQLGLKAPLISPSFTTPALGVATATSVTGATLIASGEFRLGGTNEITCSNLTSYITIRAGTYGTAGDGAFVQLHSKGSVGNTGTCIINTPNAAGSGDVARLTITGLLATAVFEVANCSVKLNLPTSNPGAGILWNDTGTVKVGT